jgi:cyclopropane fatty-acyl-phospholipid synthase-like methyltransferase
MRVSGSMKADPPPVEESVLTRIRDGLAHSIEQNTSPSPPEVSFLQRCKRDPLIIKARCDRIAYTLRMLGYNQQGPIIDIGAGAGLNAVLAVYNGVQEVHAVEYEKERFESARLLVEFLDLADRVKLYNENILDVELSSDNFSGAYSFELLEHISDIPKLYHRTNHWLAEGARIYGRTGANGLSVICNLHFLREYRTIETRPSSRYYQRRYAFIGELAPDLPEKDHAKLARNTQGYLFGEVKSALDSYLESGRIPSYKPLRAPRDPETREYMERLLNVYRLRRTIDAEGFRTKVLKPFYGAMTIRKPVVRRLAAVIGSILRLTHPLSLTVAPWIEVLSEKTGK